MKNLLLRSSVWLFLLALGLSACVDQSVTEINKKVKASIYNDASFSNVTPYEINLQLTHMDGTSVDGILVRFYGMGNITKGNEIAKGMIRNGRFANTINFGNHITELVMVTDYIGIKDYLVIPVDGLHDIEVRGMESEYPSLSTLPGQSMPEEALENRNARSSDLPISYMGSFNRQGVPDYLESGRDVVNSELLSFINASLPEGRPVPTYHPQYLSSAAENNLVVEETADVWMTFVHEGAGYRNVLGYYTYPTGSEPQSTDDISEINIVFPNASFRGSGGGLYTGDKVHLGQFDAGTTIGFVLFANGWNGSATGGYHQVYSNNNLNPESTEEKRYHTVLLYDDTNELFLLGFEDLNRDQSSDDDFNDAIIYLTANPINAIATENINPIDKPEDADGDGVNDTYDEFPDDPRYAYVYSYPGESSYGSFAFEDQWPNFGDYDFNDLVVDYNFRHLANGTNEIVKLESQFVIQAVGAGSKNGLGLQLDIRPSAIQNVTGNVLATDLFNLNANGTESGQSKAVIPITDDPHHGFEGNGFINTEPELIVQEPDTITVHIEFTNPLELYEAGHAPYNPFIVVNQNRGKEVHIPGYSPTDLVDASLFGQGNDASIPGSNIYYQAQQGHPWAMNLPVSFYYPNEKTDIKVAYHHFQTWSSSGGFSYMDWYLDNQGYRDPDHIFRK